MWATRSFTGVQLRASSVAPKSHGSCRQKSGRIGRHAGQQPGGMRQTRRVAKMILGVEKKLSWPAFLMGVLAIFLLAQAEQAQSPARDVPPPPPLGTANRRNGGGGGKSLTDDCACTAGANRKM